MSVRYLPSGNFLHSIRVKTKNREEARKSSEELIKEEQRNLDQEMVRLISENLPIWQDN